jgi:hypothetical protein
VSERGARWLLWAVALFTLPLPMWQFGEVVPVARFLLLGGVTAGLVAAEGAGRIPLLVGALFLSHALAYAALLWLAARLVAAGAARLSPRAPARVALALAAAALLLGSLFEVYRTPFAAASGRANLLHVYE